MKKNLALMICLTVLGACGAALADQWGMSGVMSGFLKKSGDYDDVRYPELNSGYSPDAEFVPFTVRKEEENLLVLLRKNAEGALEEIGRYPGALRPLPGGRATEFWLRPTEDGFRLKNMWGNTGEEYVFAFNGQELVLQYANTGSLTIALRDDGEGYTVNDGWQDSRWLSRPLALTEFRMDMLPQSSSEVWLWNAQLIYRTQLLDDAQRVQVSMEKSVTLPVYAAPTEQAYRGAEGKAAVSLAEPFDVLGAYPGGWYMVEYEITRAEKRIGFVQGLEIAAVQELQPVRTVETVAIGTPVTDDPHGARRTLSVLSAGSKVEALGMLDAFWLCVRTEVEGREAWGFIPINSVVVAEKAQAKETMAQLQGAWRTLGGGQLLGDGVIFGEDGTLTLCTTDNDDVFPPETLLPYETAAAWCVCEPWNQGAWLVVWPQTGAPSVYEMTVGLDEQGHEILEVMWGEAGGAYERWTVKP